MRVGKRQKGRFDVKPGMAFMMPAMEKILPEEFHRHPEDHPWLVLRVEDNFVEMVMCQTYDCLYEAKSFQIKEGYDNLVKFENPCPPMDPDSLKNLYPPMKPEQKRDSGYNTDMYKIFPKKELFTHELQILNRNTKERNFATEGMGSLCMSQDTVKKIRTNLMKIYSEKAESESDIFGIQQAEYDLEDAGYESPERKAEAEKSFNEKFGWEHIKPADPAAVYPYEDSMAPYEKQDKKLVEAVRKRDSRSHYHKPVSQKPVIKEQEEEEITLTEDDLKGLDGPGGQSL